MGNARRKSDPLQQRSNETFLQWQARLASERDLQEAAKQPLVTPEAMRHGQYEDGFTEVDGQRRAVKINRGGSTIARWMNDPETFSDNERAAIRYCQGLWVRLDYKRPVIVVVDNGSEGLAEHEALAELAALKVRLPIRYWNTFEDVCRWERTAVRRDTRTVVAFVASLIAMWRGL